MAELPPSVRFVADLVDERLRRLLTAERERWNRVDPRLCEAIDELARMARGGKRLRAAFCYYAWQGAMGGPGRASEAQQSTVIEAGAAFELLQTFALIHDDIMDAAATRRGEPTIHVVQAEIVASNGWRGEPRRYGEGVALLVGDLSHVYADQLIGSHSPEARRIWDLLRIELNLGQYLDMRVASSGERDRETAQRVATFKSALYTIVRPLQLGAALATTDADGSLSDQLEAFGRPIGQAFQLRDDLLGVLGDAHHVGKPVGDDLREGKATELVAVALDRAGPTQHEILSHLGRTDLDGEAAARIVDVFHDTGAVDEIERRIDQLVEAALDALKQLRFDLDTENTLSTLTHYVAARTR